MTNLYDGAGNTNYLHREQPQPANRYDGAGNNNYLYKDSANVKPMQQSVSEDTFAYVKGYN